MKSGANPSITDNNGFTALLSASYSGERLVVATLLDHGLDPNTRDLLTHKTPLHLAAFRGHLSTCQLLLSRGADADAVDNYAWTALMFAAHAGHEGVVGALLSVGVDVERVSTKGQTAEGLAVSGGHVAVAAMLRKKEKKEKKGA